MSNDSIVLYPPNHRDWLRAGHMTQVRPMSVKPRLILAILKEYFSTPSILTPMFTSKGPWKQQASLLFAKSCLTMKSTQESRAKKWKERDQSFISHWASGSCHAWILIYQFLMMFKTQFLSSKIGGGTQIAWVCLTYVKQKMFKLYFIVSLFLPTSLFPYISYHSYFTFLTHYK